MNRVNAPDGTPLVYDAYEPERPTVAVLFLHDWNPQPPESATQFADTGAQLREAGFANYFLYQRGHGRSGGRRGHLSRFSQLLGDLQIQQGDAPRASDRPHAFLHGHQPARFFLAGKALRSGVATTTLKTFSATHIRP